MVYEAADPMSSDITVQVNFPTIIESDVPAQVSAIVSAYMGGQGIDQKEAIRLLGRQVDIDNNEDVLESQYPSDGPDAYDPNRTVQQKANKDAALELVKAGPPKPGDGPPVKESSAQVKTLREAVVRLARSVRLLEAEDADSDRS
jgi:hypothetical protein